MNTKRVTLAICFLMSFSGLAALLHPTGVRAVWSGYPNDWITDNFDNTWIDNAYNITQGDTNNTGTDWKLYQLHDLNVSSMDPTDFFNITVPKCWELKGIITTDPNLVLNISYYIWTGFDFSLLGHTDFYDSQIGGYPVNSSGLVSEDTTVWINITRLSGAWQSYGIDFTLEAANSEWTVVAGNWFVYESMVNKQEEDEWEHKLYNVSVDYVGWGSQYNQMRVNIYNRSTPLCTDSWVSDWNLWLSANTFMMYNACKEEARYWDLSYLALNDYSWYLFLPQKHWFELVNKSILENYGWYLTGQDLSDIHWFVDPGSGEVTYEFQNNNYGIHDFLRFYYRWDSMGALIEMGFKNGSGELYRLQRIQTFNCIDCESGEMAKWGVTPGDTYMWRVEDGEPNAHQMMMEIVSIDLVYMTEEQRMPWGGWCTNWSMVMAKMFNRTDDCSAPWVADPYIWIPQIEMANRQPGPVIVYNACQQYMTSWLDFDHGQENEDGKDHMSPFLVIPWNSGNKPNLDVLERIMTNYDTFNYINKYYANNTIRFQYNHGFPENEVTGYFQYADNGVLKVLHVGNSSKVFLHMMLDPCQEPTGPTENPNPQFNDLPAEVGTPEVKKEFEIPAGTYTVDVGSANVKLNVSIEVTSPVNISMGLWATNPSTNNPGFKSGLPGVFFAIEVSNKSAIKGNITLTITLPPGYEGLTAADLQKYLAIGTLADGKWGDFCTNCIKSVNVAAGTVVVEISHLSVFALGYKESTGDGELGLDIPGLSPCLLVLAMLGTTALLVRKRYRK